MLDVTKRFLMFYEELKTSKVIKSKTEFYIKIGKKPESSILTELEKGRSEVGIDLLQNTVNAFPSINMNWIFTGKGKMINEYSLSDEKILHAAEPSPKHYQLTNPEKTPIMTDILKQLELLTNKVNELQEQQPPRKRTSA